MSLVDLVHEWFVNNRFQIATTTFGNLDCECLVHLQCEADRFECDIQRCAECGEEWNPELLELVELMHEVQLLTNIEDNVN